MDEETLSSMPTKSFNKEVAKVENPLVIKGLKMKRRTFKNRKSAQRSKLRKKKTMANQAEEIEKLTSLFAGSSTQRRRVFTGSSALDSDQWRVL
jgi:hypothetical protein